MGNASAPRGLCQPGHHFQEAPASNSMPAGWVAAEAGLARQAPLFGRSWPISHTDHLSHLFFSLRTVSSPSYLTIHRRKHDKSRTGTASRSSWPPSLLAPPPPTP